MVFSIYLKDNKHLNKYEMGNLKKKSLEIFNKPNNEFKARETKEVSRKLVNVIEYEPKRENRFLVRFGNLTLESWVVQKVNRPVYNFQKGWENIIIELLDPIGPSSSQKIYQEIIHLHELGELEDEYQMFIEMLDPTGVVVERWVVYGAFEEIDFGVVDYASDELATIKMKFKTTNCVLES